MKNASRSIFAFIHQKNKTLPVPISSLRVPVRGKSRYKHVEQIRSWPILLLSDWVRTSFEDPFAGYYFLGGHRLDQLDTVKAMLGRFWTKYKVVDSMINPQHPEITIPFFLHGDEGRGQGKQPVLILAAQPVIGWCGEESITSTKSFAKKLAVFFFGTYKLLGPTRPKFISAWVPKHRIKGTHSPHGSCWRLSLHTTMRPTGPPCKQSCNSWLMISTSWVKMVLRWVVENWFNPLKHPQGL